MMLSKTERKTAELTRGEWIIALEHDGSGWVAMHWTRTREVSAPTLRKLLAKLGKVAKEVN